MTEELFQDLLVFLKGQVIGVVSTVSQAGEPESATVFYWANDIDKKRKTFDLYFVTRRHTRKFQNLLFNKAVAFVIGTEFRSSTLQLQGEAELIESADGFKDLTRFVKGMIHQPKLAAIYAGSFLPRNPFTKLEGENFAVIKVRPTWVRWMRFDETDQRPVYHQILG
ncbi:MAG TPA: pyridoxamine 5'-phosphate oxidase family protein [Candidatus Eisenbacteria bacterium]|nr:pyridoxamine 5'-phosphate oxidase family protein [Candidatus Eisenbacteria bacterium]